MFNRRSISATYSVFSEGPKALQFQIGGFYFPSQAVVRQWNKVHICRNIGLCVSFGENLRMLVEEVARLQVCAEEYSATSLFSLPSYNGGNLLVTENSCLHSTNTHVVVCSWHRHQLKVVSLYLLPVLFGAPRPGFFLRDWHLEHGRVRPGISNDVQMLEPG